MAPAITFPVFWYIMVELNAVNRNIGIAIGKKEPK